MFWKKKSQNNIDYYKKYCIQNEQHLRQMVDFEVMHEVKINELKSKYEEKITELEKQLQDQLEVNQKYIQDLHDSKIYENAYRNSYEVIKQQMDKQIDLCIKQMDDCVQREKMLVSLESSVAAICEERVNENIELFALKTYRGWKCLYVDGEKIDTDSVKSICINNEDKINVTIDS